MQLSLLCAVIVCFSLTCLAPTAVMAQQEPKADLPTNATSANVGKAMHNPLANLKEVFFQIDILPNVGPYDNTAWSLSVEPLYPFNLGNDWRLVTYTIVPLISQPGLTPETDRTNGLGDTTLFGYFVPPNEGSLIWGFGPTFQLPTHSDDDLGNDEWAAGPALIIGSQPGN